MISNFVCQRPIKNAWQSCATNQFVTPHAEAVRLMEQGWRWNGRKYANREAWHAAMHESFFKKYGNSH